MAYQFLSPVPAWVFLLSSFPSSDWFYTRVKQEMIYTEDSEYQSSNLAPKHLPQWIDLKNIRV